MVMNISGPPWVVDIPAGNALALTAAQVQAVVDLVSGAWKSASGPTSKRRIALVGDSLWTNNYLPNGYAVTPAPALHAAIPQVIPEFNVPTGGVCTLKFNETTNMLSFKSFGNDYGASVDVSTGGVYTLTDGAGYTCLARVRYHSLTGAGGETEYALTLGTNSNRYLTGAVQGCLESLYPGRFTWVNFGVGGAYASDVYASRAQIAAANVDAVLEQVGTNDIGANAVAVAAYVAQRVANWDYFNSLGLPVLAGLIPPRTTNTYGVNTQYANALLVNEARSRSGVQIIDTCSAAIDPSSATGAIRTGWTVDGVHPAAPLGLWMAQNYGAALDRMFQAPARPAFRVSSGSNYDATLNPYGTLLVGSTGSFNGTGGTVGTRGSVVGAWSSGATAATAGVTVVISNSRAYIARTTATAGTIAPTHASGAVTDGAVIWECITKPGNAASVGFAAGWTGGAASGSNMAVQYWKEDDGQGSNWQCVLASSATTGERWQFYPTPPTIGNFTAGDLINMSIDIEVADLLGSVTSCTGVYTEITSGTFPGGSIVGASQLVSSIGLVGQYRLSMPEALKWPSGVSSCTAKVQIQSASGGLFVTRLRQFELFKTAA